MVGDYDAAGRGDIFWYGKGSRDVSRAFSGGNGRFTYVDTVISGWFAPAVGDFDGNGHDDVFWYAPGTAEDGIWWGEPGRRGTVRQTSTSVKGEGYRPLVGDLNGDGREDLLWYKTGRSEEHTSELQSLMRMSYDVFCL